MLRWLSAGESHGEALVGILDGIPAGVSITTSDLEKALSQRRLGYGRGARMQFEKDEVSFLGGVRHGQTTGAPIAILIKNTEWPKWRDVMSADPVEAARLLVDAGKGDEREIARNRPLTRPRPGHADLVGMLKYDLDDARPILERASARETAMRVALGMVAKAALQQISGATLVCHVVAVGGVTTPTDGIKPTPADEDYLDADPIRCFDRVTSEKMIQRIDEAKSAGDTLGGVVEVLAYDVPVGLGTHVQADRRLDARLASALMGIQAIKSVEIGDGLVSTTRPGSQAHDQITPGTGTGFTRLSNHAGGIEGGTSNGEVIVVRAGMKPISTVPRALQTVDLATKEPAQAIHQRSDVCAVAPAAVVAGSMVALELTKALLELTGGDSVRQCRQALEYYQKRIGLRQ